MIDLHKGARPDEVFHVQAAQPTFRQWSCGVVRWTVWENIYLADGTPGRFVSRWLFNRLQWYQGTVKCDGTRTAMLNRGDLGEPTPGYVMTTTPTELAAFRWRSNGPGEAQWDNMGGS
jgi:hypothetical protein